jgi:membrane complex biogenesis BtpA family protein
LLFCNEHDIPYQLRVGPEIVAAMAAAVGRVRSQVRKPFGVDILWDPKAALAVARAVGASFVREIFTGVFESDLGVIAPDPGDLAGFQTAIGAQDVALFTNITPEFSRSVGGRTVAERARGAAFLGFDALLISGPAAGVSIEMDELKAARKAVPNIPLLANTGVNHSNVREILSNCDGVIVGTSLKVDGNTWNPVDPSRARQMVELVAGAREQVPAR